MFDSDLAPFGDCDNSPSKKYLINHSDKYLTLFRLAFAKRPYEELYDLRKDPQQFVNVADKEEYRQIKEKLSGRLDEWMKKTRDPRSESPRTMAFDKY